MGGILTVFTEKGWTSQGYYPDLTTGFVSRAGGAPKMIKFPKELQTVPQRCTNCRQDTDLDWNEMYHRLDIQRLRFRDQVNQIVAARIAKGEPEPYPKQITEEDKRLHPFLLLKRLFKKNAVTPSIESDEPLKDPYNFNLDINEMIVCQRCSLHSLSAADYEDDNDDEESHIQYPNFGTDGCELDEDVGLEDNCITIDPEEEHTCEIKVYRNSSPTGDNGTDSGRARYDY